MMTMFDEKCRKSVVSHDDAMVKEEKLEQDPGEEKRREEGSGN